MSSSEAINIHVYPSPFKNESRILRITESLSNSNLFDRIWVIATWESDLLRQEDIDPKRRIIRIGQGGSPKQLNFLFKLMKMLKWNLEVFFFLFKVKFDCLNCHSLSVLPICVLLKWLKGSVLIYDTHELETETASSRGIRKYLAKFVEFLFISFADAIVVVNESISDWYKEHYGLKKIWVLRNLPHLHRQSFKKNEYMRKAFGIRPDEMIFLYQGVFGKGRGIHLLLKVFKELNHSKHILFLGYGDEVPLIKAYEDKYPNIHFHPAVKPDEIISVASGADVGISIIEDVCLSYYLCLPNKVFEYIASGLPVIVSNFPEMSAVINKYHCGWTCAVTEKGLRSILENLTWNDIESKSIDSLKARNNLGWHVEEPVLMELYRELGFSEKCKPQTK